MTYLRCMLQVALIVGLWFNPAVGFYELGLAPKRSTSITSTSTASRLPHDEVLGTRSTGPASGKCWQHGWAINGI